MLSTIDASVRYFCEDILNLPVQDTNKNAKEFFGASIPLVCNNLESHYYLLIEPNVLDAFGKVLLGEPTLKEADKDDLCKEVANIVIGHAKVSLEQKRPEDKFLLGTPEFLGQIPYPLPLKMKQSLCYQLQSGLLIVGKGIKDGK